MTFLCLFIFLVLFGDGGGSPSLGSIEFCWQWALTKLPRYARVLTQNEAVMLKTARAFGGLGHAGRKVLHLGRSKDLCRDPNLHPRPTEPFDKSFPDKCSISPTGGVARWTTNLNRQKFLTLMLWKLHETNIVNQLWWDSKLIRKVKTSSSRVIYNPENVFLHWLASPRVKREKTKLY